jgi:MFS family permease
MIAAVIGVPFAISAFMVASPEMAVILVGIFIFIVSGYVSLPLTALISLVPSRLRGKTASIVGLVCATTGAVLGPLMVATLTDRVFHDPKMVGKSILTCLVVLGPLVVILFAATLKPLRNLAAANKD